jgi:hypothetical protein
MSKLLKGLFLLAAVLGFLTGAPLLLAPGRALGLLAWDVVDPLITRLLGAALLALAWGSLRAYLSAERERMQALAEVNAVFTILGALGFLRHLLTGSYYPPVIWVIFAALALFALAWVFALVRLRAS